jgi:hypothetical protein
MLCSCALFVACSQRAFFLHALLSSFLCEVHRCTSCDLLWDRRVDIGHFT